MDLLQFASRTKHSTLTTPLKVQSDIISSRDEEGSAVVLVLHEFSATFDTNNDHFFYRVYLIWIIFVCFSNVIKLTDVTIV